MRLARAIVAGTCVWVGQAFAEDAPKSLLEADRPVIEFQTVAAAREALTHRAGVEVYSQQGWTIVRESGGLTLWSFVPDSHPAYPAVAKRVLSSKDGSSWSGSTAIHCEATKEACDQLVRDFNELNEQMRQDIEKHHGRDGSQ